MSLIVQKFGGSSVADADGVRRVARRVAETRNAGNQVVVVVSAMGDTTDDLLDLAGAAERDLRAAGEQFVRGGLLPGRGWRAHGRARRPARWPGRGRSSWRSCPKSRRRQGQARGSSRSAGEGEGARSAGGIGSPAGGWPGGKHWMTLGSNGRCSTSACWRLRTVAAMTTPTGS